MLLVNENESIGTAVEAVQALGDQRTEDTLTVLFEMPDNFDIGFDFDFDEISKEAGNDKWHLIF